MWSVVSCGAPPVVPSGVYRGHTWIYLKTVQAQCWEGYQLHGNGQLVCSSSGNWSGAAPQCLPMQCPELTMPKHAQLSDTNTTYTATVALICDAGFRPIGSIRQITCTSSGLWSGHLEDCQIVRCPVLLVPDSVVESNSTPVYGGDLSWSCAPGYVLLSGDAVRLCQANGDWSGDQLQCSGKLLLLKYSFQN